MANQDARQDRNRFPALTAHRGTAGTSDIVKVIADAAGNLGVNIITGEVVASLGTVNVVENLAKGTITEVENLQKGTITELESGSITSLASGTITGGTIQNLDSGSIVMPSGTVTTIVAGTQNTLGTVGTNIGVGTVTNVGSLTDVGTVKEVTLVDQSKIFGTYDIFAQDASTEAMTTISYEHHEIHSGSGFEVHIDSANLLVATLNVAFKTLSGAKWIHMLIGWASSDEVKFEIIEGATWDQGSGTERTIRNNNRNSDNLSTVMLEDKGQAEFTASNTVIEDVTTPAGTVIDTQYTYNAGIPQAHEAESRAVAHEWILKADTQYIIRLTKTDANCKMNIDLHWYEHTAKN